MAEGTTPSSGAMGACVALSTVRLSRLSGVINGSPGQAGQHRGLQHGPRPWEYRAPCADARSIWRTPRRFHPEYVPAVPPFVDLAVACARRQAWSRWREPRLRHHRLHAGAPPARGPPGSQRARRANKFVNVSSGPNTPMPRGARSSGPNSSRRPGFVVPLRVAVAPVRRTHMLESARSAPSALTCDQSPHAVTHATLADAAGRGAMRRGAVPCAVGTATAAMRTPTRLITASQPASTSSSATGSCTPVCDKVTVGTTRRSRPRAYSRVGTWTLVARPRPASRDQMTACEAGAALRQGAIRN